jgi:putative tricarboxylic transport membrane protein
VRWHAQRADAAIAIGLLAAGIFFAFQTYALPEAPGYAQVGPRLFPGLIATGLIACGAALAYEALTGGFRKLPASERPPIDWRAFAWVSTGVIAHMAAIGWVGFIVASTVLFTCVARAFGSTRTIRDALLGLLLAATTFFVFTQGLGLALPSGLPSAKS